MKLKNDSHIHLRLFKNIPCGEIEQLLPMAEIKMTQKDKMTLVGSGALAAVTGYSRLFDGFVSLLGGAAGLESYIDRTPFVLGAIGFLTFRVWNKYRNSRNAHLVHLSKTLFFKSLGSNRGALSLIVARAEGEELKEAFLAYVLLLHAASKGFSSSSSLASSSFSSSLASSLTSLDSSNSNAVNTKIDPPPRVFILPSNKIATIAATAASSAASAATRSDTQFNSKYFISDEEAKKYEETKRRTKTWKALGVYLEQDVEDWLLDNFSVLVKYDVADSLAKLERMGLVFYLNESNCRNIDQLKTCKDAIGVVGVQDAIAYMKST